MAGKFKYTIDIDADISSIQGKLKSLSTLMDAATPNFSKKFDTGLGDLNKDFKKIQDMANQPITSLGEFSKLETKIESFKNKLASLENTYKQLMKGDDAAKMQILPQSELDKVKIAKTEFEELSKAVTTYNTNVAAMGQLKTNITDQETKIADLTQQWQNATKKVDAYNTATDNTKTAINNMADKYNVAQRASRPDQTGAATEKEIRARMKEYEEHGGADGGPGDKRLKEYKTLKQDLDAIIQAQTKWNQLKSETTKNTFKQDQDAVKVLQSQVNKANEELDKLRKNEEDLAKVTSIDDLNNKFNGTLQKLQQIDGLDLSGINGIQDIQKLGTAISNLEGAQAEQARQTLESLRQTLEGLGLNCEELDKILGKTGKGLQQLDGKSSNLNMLKSRIEYTFSLYNGYRLLTSQIKKAYQATKELDESMTATAVVTDYSVGDMWDKLPEYTENANALGVSINDMYNAATLYYQQGLETNEVMELSVETLKMARIAGLEAEEATNRMTAALRAFNMELNEDSAQRINDVYSQVAAVSASNVDELSTAMSKVASLAANVGMSFEQTTAYLATGIETTRESADSIGTALKTVLARFAEMKKDPALAEEVDGETVDVNKVETALKTVGIALRDSNGQIRNMGDVFEELNKKWNTLDVNTQRYIATMAAGSRQQSRFIAMMQDYTRTSELYNEAINSSGASQEQFEKTLESLETKIQNLNNAWQTFTTTMVNSDLIKGAIDALTTVVTYVNNFIEKLPTGIFKSVTSVTLLITTFLLLGNVVKATTATIFENLTTIAKGEAVAAEGAIFLGKKWRENFKASWKAMGPMLPYLLAIAGAIAAIVVIAKKWHAESLAGQIEAVTETLDELQNTLDTIEDNLTNIATLKSNISDYQDVFMSAKKGSDEWNEALQKNNEEVLELASSIDNALIGVGSHGELVITNLDTIEEEQTKLKNVSSMSTAVANKQLINLNLEKAVKDGFKQYRDLDSDKKSSKLTQSDLLNLAKTQASGQAITNDLTVEELKIVNDIANELNITNSKLNAQTSILAQGIVLNSNIYDTLSASQSAASTSIVKDIINSDFQSAVEEDIEKKLDPSTYVRELYKNNPYYASWSDEQIESAVQQYESQVTGNVTNTNENNNIIKVAEDLGYAVTANTKWWNTLFGGKNATTFEIEGVEGEKTVDAMYDFLKASAIEQQGQEASSQALSYVASLTDAQAETLYNLNEGLSNDLIGDMLDATDIQSAEAIFANYFDVDSISDFTNQLGFSVEAAKAFADAIQSSAQAEAARRYQAKRTAVTNAMTSQRDSTTIQGISNLTADQIDVINSAYDAALEHGTEAVQAMYDTLDLDQLGTSEYAEFLTWLNKQDFSNPIEGLNNLNLAMQNDNKNISQFAQTYAEIADTQFSGSAQLSYLLDANNYEDLNKELDKTYKKYHKITGEKVDDLAQSYDDLNQVLENTELTASDLADILTSIQKNELDVDDITERVIRLSKSFKTVDNNLQELHTTIEGYDDIYDSFEGMETYFDYYETIKEKMIDKASGNTVVQEYMERIFGEDAINDIYKLGDTEAINTALEEKMNKMSDMFSNSGQKFWNDYAKDTDNQVEGFTAHYISDTELTFDAVTMTYGELIEQLATNQGITEEAANAELMNLLEHNPALKAQLDKNSYFDALLNIAEESGDIITTSQDELQIIADKYGYNYDETVKYVKKYAEANGKQLQVFDWSLLTADNIEEQFGVNNLLSGDITKNLGLTETEMAGVWDFDSTLKKLGEIGISEDLYDEVINWLINSQGLQFAKQYVTYDENGNAVTAYAGSEATSYDGITQAYAAALKDNDYKDQATTFIGEFDNSATGQNIDEIKSLVNAIKLKVVNNETPESTTTSEANAKKAEENKTAAKQGYDKWLATGNIGLDEGDDGGVATANAYKQEVKDEATQQARDIAAEGWVPSSLTDVDNEAETNTPSLYDRLLEEQVEKDAKKAEEKAQKETEKNSHPNVTEVDNRPLVDQWAEKLGSIDYDSLLNKLTFGLFFGDSDANSAKDFWKKFEFVPEADDYIPTATSSTATPSIATPSTATSSVATKSDAKKATESQVEIITDGIVTGNAEGAELQNEAIVEGGTDAAEIISEGVVDGAKEATEDYISQWANIGLDEGDDGGAALAAANAQKKYYETAKNIGLDEGDTGGTTTSVEQAKANAKAKYEAAKAKAEEAQKLADADKGATSTSSFNTGTQNEEEKDQYYDYVERHYDWLYNKLQQINKLQNERELTEKRISLMMYNAAEYGEAIASATDEQVQSIRDEYQMQSEIAAGRALQIEQLQKEASNRIIRDVQMKDGTTVQEMPFDLTQFAKVVNGAVQIDYDKIIAETSNRDYGAELSSEIDEYIGNLEELVQDEIDAEETMCDLQEEYIQLARAGESTFSSLVSDIASALQELDQEVIDEKTRLADSLADIQSDIVDTLQDNISSIRQDLDNEEEQDELNKVQRRLAYLRQDTTGANQKEILTLEKQLKKDTRTYQEKLVDQAIEDIQKDNEIAQEQRQEEIDLLQAQVDYNEKYGQYHRDAESKIVNAIDSDGNINIDSIQSLMEATTWKGLTESEIGLKQGELATNLGTMVQWASANGTTFEGLLDQLANDQESYFGNNLGTIAANTTKSYTAELNNISGKLDNITTAIGNLSNGTGTTNKSGTTTQSTTKTTQELKDAEQAYIKKLKDAGTVLDDGSNNKAGYTDDTGTLEKYLQQHDVNSKEQLEIERAIRKNTEQTKITQKFTELTALLEAEPTVYAAEQRQLLYDELRTAGLTDSDIESSLLKLGWTSQQVADLQSSTTESLQQFNDVRNAVADSSSGFYQLITNAPTEAAEAQAYATWQQLINNGITKEGIEGALTTLGWSPDQIATLEKVINVKDQETQAAIEKAKEAAELAAKNWEDTYGSDASKAGNDAADERGTSYSQVSTISDTTTVVGDRVYIEGKATGVYTTAGTKGGSYVTDSRYMEEFATGGIANYTGYAWLDGTKAKPELVLNADDTEKFLTGISILRQTSLNTDYGTALDATMINALSNNFTSLNNAIDEIKTLLKSSINTQENNTMSTVNVTVSGNTIASDYDVDELAEEVEKKIASCMNYRNVVSYTRSTAQY